MTSPLLLGATVALFATACNPTDGPTASAAILPETAHADAVTVTLLHPPTPSSPLADCRISVPLVERYGDAVVNVEVIGSAHRDDFRGMSESEDDPLHDFFRRFGMPGPGARRRAGRRSCAAAAPASSSARTATSSPTRTSSPKPTKSPCGSPTGASSRPRSSARDARTDVAVIKIEAKRPAGRQHRRSRRAQDRRMGARDRLAVRPREHARPPASSAHGALRAAAAAPCRSSRPTSP